MNEPMCRPGLKEGDKRKQCNFLFHFGANLQASVLPIRNGYAARIFTVSDSLRQNDVLIFLKILNHQGEAGCQQRTTPLLFSAFRNIALGHHFDVGMGDMEKVYITIFTRTFV